MVEFSTREDAGQLIRLTPNRSIGGLQLALVFAGLSTGCLGLAAILALQGYWPTLLFAGVVLVALAGALRAVYRWSAQVEELCIDGGNMSVERRRDGRLWRRQFQLAWLRIELKPGRYRWYPRRLVLASHGRELEIGRFLADSERRQLARRLTELTTRRSPLE